MSQRLGFVGRSDALWRVRAVDTAASTLFYGTLVEMVAHINRLHRESGIQHAGRQIGA
jgi:hypothetical protein